MRTHTTSVRRRLGVRLGLFPAALIAAWLTVPAGALPPPGQWVYDPAERDLGTVQVGSSSQATVSFTNNGQVPVNVTVCPASAGQAFSVPPNTQVGVGQTVQVPVTFTPPYNGQFTGALWFNEPNRGGSASVPLKGEGSGATLECNPTLVDFGRVLLGTRRSLAVTLTNRNTQPIDIVSLGVRKPFSGLGSPGTLQPGQSIDLQLAFRPKKAKKYEENLNIAILKGSESSTVRLPLIGEGVEFEVGAVDGKLNFKNVGSNVFHVRETWIYNATANPVELVARNTYDAEFFHQRYPDTVVLDAYDLLELALLFGAIRICEHSGKIKIKWRRVPIPAGGAAAAGAEKGSFTIKLKANTSS